MKRPKVHRSKARIVSGPTKVKTVAKVRRTKTEAYGNLYDWLKICAAVKRRDGYKCRKCGRPEHELGLHVDHIIEVSRGGQTIMSNLRCLCPICHADRPSHRSAKHLILHEAKTREQRRLPKGPRRRV